MKTVYRRLMNARLRPILAGLRGRVLDLASGAAPSYRAFFNPRAEAVNGDVSEDQGVERIDFDALLPFADASFDHALCINALYIAKYPGFTLGELRRVTRAGGTLTVAVPFVFPEAPEPHDYARWTSEGLRSLLVAAGFHDVAIVPFGGHFTSALFIVEPFMVFRPLKFLAQESALLLDRLVPARYRAARPCPLGYVAIAKR